MLTEIDQQLQSWAQASLTGRAAEVTLDAPRPDRSGQGVSLYLIELAPAPPARGIRPPPHQLLARYLVTTWADQPGPAHDLLETLLFAAWDRPDYTVELAPLPPAAWVALGVPPRPAFMVGVLVQRARGEPPAPRVRQPLEVETAPLVPVHGRVFGPGDIPLPNAHVELPALQISVQTDGRGRFRIAGVPTQPPTTHLRVHAKGHTQDVAIKPGKLKEEGVIVRFDALEDAS